MTSSKLNWCIVRLGEDYNWWVQEVSDDIHWDVDGLGILDPNQVEHMVDLLIQMKPYGLREDIVENAFIAYSIEKELPKNMVRLVVCNEELLSTKDKVFALPNAIDESDGPYVDFLDHIISVRVKMLNANLDFHQPMEVEEIEEAIRDEQRNGYISGKSVHSFDEIMSILDYVPTGYSLDLEDQEEDKDEIDFSDVDDGLGEDESSVVNGESWEE
ncbi:MAG: hypothetical protein K2L13_02740 [Opitutales bacterium]|nr:hypothetical protein [Opitutales bacterium]